MKFTTVFNRPVRQSLLGVMGVCTVATTFAHTAPEAQAQEVRNFCRPQESVFVAAETKDFWVSICGSDNPITYVGVNKKTRKSLRLNLSDYDARGRYFEAVNNGYTYILADSTKGKNLTVSRGTKEILRQPVIKGW